MNMVTTHSSITEHEARARRQTFMDHMDIGQDAVL
jgi:hypothetical protein